MNPKHHHRLVRNETHTDAPESFRFRFWPWPAHLARKGRQAVTGPGPWCRTHIQRPPPSPWVTMRVHEHQCPTGGRRLRGLPPHFKSITISPLGDRRNVQICKSYIGSVLQGCHIDWLAHIPRGSSCRRGIDLHWLRPLLLLSGGCPAARVR